MSVESFATVCDAVDTAVLSNAITYVVTVQLPELTMLRVFCTPFDVKEREYFNFQKNYFVNRMY